MQRKTTNYTQINCQEERGTTKRVKPAKQKSKLTSEKFKDNVLSIKSRTGWWINYQGENIYVTGYNYR